MKKLLFLSFIVAMKIQFLAGQPLCYDYWITFDSPYCLQNITIDTTSYPNNIWQIGHYNKPGFDSSACLTKVIITDTINPYPANDTSVFYIRSLANNGVYDMLWFSADYYVQTDSLKDYGKIEFSPDNGTTWIDIIADTVYPLVFQWQTPKPVLTGYSGYCNWFDVMISELHSVFDLDYGDTLTFRYTFISDSTQDNLCGIIFDNISLYQWVEGISKIRYTPVKSTIHPNPSADFLTIEFDNPAFESFELSVYDIHSKLLLKNDHIITNSIVINAQSFPQGTYIYKLINPFSKKRSWGKFVIKK
ncbi:MAG: T9SS type A sorting domain-containing protein [Bacteroidetes bacterium]|nr:T9SS type A sorting domain-containing protein [Bacteroidota bacterium]